MTTAATPPPAESLLRLQRVLRAMTRAPSARVSSRGRLLALTASQTARVSVPFQWGSADLTFPVASRLQRPVGVDSWAVVVTPKGEIHEVSQAAQAGQRVAANRVETIAALIDSGGLAWDQRVGFE